MVWGRIAVRASLWHKGGMEADEYHLMDQAEDSMWWYRALHRRLCDALGGLAGPVLDAGCGTGGLLATLARHGRTDLFGLEYDAAAAARAAAKSGAAVACGSIQALPFEGAWFAAAVAADVLCHAAVDPPLALAELRRVLRPGGLLVVNMPAYAWLASAHDRRVHNARRTTAPCLRADLVAAGFTDVRVRYWNSLLLPLMVVQRLALARGPQSRSDVAAFSPWVDRMFHAMTRLEAALPPLPAGGSVLAIATKPFA